MHRPDFGPLPPRATCPPALLWALAAGLLLAPASASAGTISLSLSPRAEIRDGALSVRLNVRNGGDEAARSLSPSLAFRDQTIRGQVLAELPPNQTAEFQLALPATELADGRWPFRVSIEYTDANAYPFYALHVGIALVGSPPPAKVAFLELAAEPLAGTGSLSPRLKNLGAKPVTVELALHLPEGIELLERIPPLELAAYAEQSLDTSLVNRTALPGSRYAIFASAEYDDGDVHQAAVATGLLEIAEEGPGFTRMREALWVAAGVIVLGWAGFFLWRRGRGQPRSD
jgi:hypothetical protein